jgi:hypothetical protein
MDKVQETTFTDYNFFVIPTFLSNASCEILLLNYYYGVVSMVVTVYTLVIITTKDRQWISTTMSE